MIKYTPESWFRMLFKLSGSVLPRLVVRIILGLLISVFVIYIHQYHYAFSVTTTIHKLIAVALGLLLVFRTNASYDRYWAGWRLVGELAYYSQDLLRKFCVYTQDTVNEDANPADISSYQTNIASVKSLLKATQRMALLSMDDDEDYSTLKEHLSAEQIEYLHSIEPSTRFSVVLTWMSQCVHNKSRRVQGPLRASLNQNLSQLGKVMIEMKRIQQTPIPFAYAQHLKIFLVLFCYTLPVALVSQMGWWTVMASGIATFALFGIDEIGVEIEDPFGDDPNDLPIHQTLMFSEQVLDQIHDALGHHV